MLSWHIHPSLKLYSEAAAIFSKIIYPFELHRVSIHSFIQHNHAQFRILCLAQRDQKRCLMGTVFVSEIKFKDPEYQTA